MKKRKIFTILLTLMLAFCTCIGFVACKEPSGQTGSQNQKYDVSIRVACDDGNSWVFTPDMDEIRIERNYDGSEHRYYVQAYQLPEHPQFGDTWLSPSGEGANVIYSSILYTAPDGKQSTELRKVKDRGEYVITIDASHTSNLWNFREVYFYITVK